MPSGLTVARQPPRKRERSEREARSAERAGWAGPCFQTDNPDPILRSRRIASRNAVAISAVSLPPTRLFAVPGPPDENAVDCRERRERAVAADDTKGEGQR